MAGSDSEATDTEKWIEEEGGSFNNTLGTGVSQGLVLGGNVSCGTNLGILVWAALFFFRIPIPAGPGLHVSVMVVVCCTVALRRSPILSGYFFAALSCDDRHFLVSHFP